jgi:hypothetical protein
LKGGIHDASKEIVKEVEREKSSCEEKSSQQKEQREKGRKEIVSSSS